MRLSLACCYIQAVSEIEQQLESAKVDGTLEFDEIVMACGSGGTTAGLPLACHLSNMESTVHASEYFHDYVQGLPDGLQAHVASRDIVRVINARLCSEHKKGIEIGQRNFRIDRCNGRSGLQVSS